MLTLFDFPTSRNAWKVRLLLNHLGRAYRAVQIDIFQAEGQRAEYLRRNPTGKVPAIQLPMAVRWPNRTRSLRISLRAAPTCRPMRLAGQRCCSG
jgi:glutathione S-transferase